MIIIEGPDSSGKTTLCERLSKDLGGITINHFGGPPLSYAETIERSFMSISLMTQRIIQDRTPLISEPVYGRILRTDNVEYVTWPASFPVLKKMEPVIIYCRPPLQALGEIASHEIKDYDTPEHVANLIEFRSAIIYRYDKLMDILRPSRYDFEGDTDGVAYANILTACNLKLEEIKNCFSAH